MEKICLNLWSIAYLHIAKIRWTLAHTWPRSAFWPTLWKFCIFVSVDTKVTEWNSPNFTMCLAVSCVRKWMWYIIKLGGPPKMWGPKTANFWSFMMTYKSEYIRNGTGYKRKRHLTKRIPGFPKICLTMTHKRLWLCGVFWPTVAVIARVFIYSDI